MAVHIWNSDVIKMAAFFVSFITVLLAELGDKTQLVTLTLCCRFPARQVLAGALGALAVITALAVVLGEFLASLVPQNIILIAGGLLFLLMGAWMALKKEEEDQEREKPVRGVALQTFILVFFSELGDKTQLAAIALTAAYGNPLAVFLGCMSGLAVNHFAAAYLGSSFLSRLPEKAVTLAGAALFMVFGVLFLVSGLL